MFPLKLYKLFKLEIILPDNSVKLPEISVENVTYILVIYIRIKKYFYKKIYP